MGELIEVSYFFQSIHPTQQILHRRTVNISDHIYCLNVIRFLYFCPGTEDYSEDVDDNGLIHENPASINWLHWLPLPIW